MGSIIPKGKGSRTASVGSLLLLLGVAAILVDACGTTAPVVRPPTPIRDTGHDKAIVFLHGIFGDAETTWRNASSGSYWPKLIEDDQDFRSYDIYVWSYESPFTSRTSTIEEIAQRLLQQLRDQQMFTRYSELYFITHSMGGLVGKRMLVDLNRPTEVDNLRRVRGILYISTPAGGAPLAELGSWLSFNPQLKDMKPVDLNTFLQSLEYQWQALLRDRDDTHAVFPQSFCAYETKPTLGKMVVSRVYAATRCDNPLYPIDLDHESIAKPLDAKSDPYPWAKHRILEAAFRQPRTPGTGEWRTARVRLGGEDQPRDNVAGDYEWRDIYWSGASGWLVGAKGTGGGAGQYLGRGVVMYSGDRGEEWREIKKERFLSGRGTLSHWGQTWDEVGPIYSIGGYNRATLAGQFQLEGWLASVTGIYFSHDPVGGVWARVTPPPDGPEGYAHFGRMASVEGYREIYAVGWQGIAHWVRGRAWELEMPTYSYPILGVFVFGDANRDAWAVGRAGVDEEGRTGSDSHGAVYRLAWPGRVWKKMRLSGVTFRPGQALRDIMQIDYDTVLAVGDSGLIIRGNREGADWRWRMLDSNVQDHLLSIAYDHGKRILWAVGSGGRILKSADGGERWKASLVEDDHGQIIDIGKDLHRIRLENGGWIVGDHVLLKAKVRN